MVDLYRSASHNDGENGEKYDIFCGSITCGSTKFWNK